MTIASVRQAVPRSGELRKKIRSKKPRRSAGYILSALIERGLYVTILGGLVLEIVRAGLGRADHGATAFDASRMPLVQLTAAVVSILCLVFFAKTLLAFGPLYVGAPARVWILSTPVDRAGLLVGRLAAAVSIGAVTSAALGIAFLAMTRLAVPLAAWLAMWAALGVTGTCVCVLVQAAGYRSVYAVQRGLNTAVYTLVGVASAILILRSGYLLSSLERAGTVTYTVWTVVSLTAASIAFRCAYRGLSTLTRGAVSSGSDLATATQVSVLSLDSTFISSIILERRMRAVARVRPAPISGNRFVALVKTDLARVLRMPTGLFTWAALISVPYAAHATGLTAFLPAVHTVAGFVAVDRLSGGLRIIARSSAIRRALGGSNHLLTLAHLVIPAAGAAIWSAATAALISDISVLTATVSAVGAVLVAYRVATRPPIDYSSSLIDFGLFGPTPVGLILQLLRGPALLVGLSLAQTALAG
ncbi:DUF6297 family protein [Planomonospora sp. ID82291]|uniref:DUF6297 family protein n=1 Tax=Planomonospora sp. ID82291 TaxID=2738136 RepID=UPI0018C358D9|nr:DUF6297 family protein [Planomonospora sp. ID82291]MBG0812790.1 hypothetical protein [Planomonospora sp. ID82291]